MNGRPKRTVCRFVYQLLDLDAISDGPSAVPALVDAAERLGFAGLNITHPCKQSVIAHLTELSESAHALGAVNTVVFRDARRIGHNTDWWGFRESVRAGLAGSSLDRVVQLGAGGAGAATAYAALEMGAKRLDIVDRVHDRATALARRLEARFPARVSAATDVQRALETADGLIHATPTGMAMHPGLPLPVEMLRS